MTSTYLTDGLVVGKCYEKVILKPKVPVIPKRATTPQEWATWDILHTEPMGKFIKSEYKYYYFDLDGMVFTFNLNGKEHWTVLGAEGYVFREVPCPSSVGGKGGRGKTYKKTRRSKKRSTRSRR
jgi:hypothetical protein